MRTLSRHLPPNSVRQRSWLDRVGAYFIGGFALLVALLVFLLHPVEMVVILGVCAAGYKLLKFIGRSLQTEFAKKMAQRTGENICTFRRSFNLRQVDPWIVRAVYEEVRATMDCGDGSDYPIRAEDRLEKDLLIEVEDWELIISDVAARAGYDLADYEKIHCMEKYRRSVIW